MSAGAVRDMVVAALFIVGVVALVFDTYWVIRFGHEVDHLRARIGVLETRP